MFILSSVIMKWRCSLDMSNPFVNLIFYSEWGFYSDLLFIFIPHIFKASCAGFLRFMLFPSVLWEGVSTMQWKECAYLLFLFPIRWGSLGELAATELPGGRGVGYFLCGIKGLCSFEGVQVIGELRGQRWMSVTQGLPWRAGRSPRGDGQNLQELTATRNEPLRNLAIQCLEMDCTKEEDKLCRRIDFHYIWGGSFWLFGAEPLECVAQRGGGGVIPGSIQAQVVLVSEKPGLADVPLGRSTAWSWEVPSNLYYSIILWTLSDKPPKALDVRVGRI